MAAAATPATAAATFFFFAVRRFPSFPATFDARDFAFPPARFAVFLACCADFLMLAMNCLRAWGGIRRYPGRYLVALADPTSPSSPDDSRSTLAA